MIIEKEFYLEDENEEEFAVTVSADVTISQEDHGPEVSVDDMTIEHSERPLTEQEENDVISMAMKFEWGCLAAEIEKDEYENYN